MRPTVICVMAVGVEGLRSGAINELPGCGHSEIPGRHQNRTLVHGPVFGHIVPCVNQRMLAMLRERFSPSICGFSIHFVLTYTDVGKVRPPLFDCQERLEVLRKMVMLVRMLIIINSHGRQLGGFKRKTVIVSSVAGTSFFGPTGGPEDAGDHRTRASLPVQCQQTRQSHRARFRPEQHHRAFSHCPPLGAAPTCTSLADVP
jgi:hypothetical protein